MLNRVFDTTPCSLLWSESVPLLVGGQRSPSGQAGGSKCLLRKLVLNQPIHKSSEDGAEYDRDERQ